MAGFPFGCAVCEVEIDPDTGHVEIARYTAIDDVGRAINPLILHGQTHGGIAQGVGQALWEHSHYDPQSGQLLTGSMMDYAMPRAHMMPSFNTELSETLAPGNPLGVRGGGEGGTTPALGVVVNAVVDALSDYGVTHIEMPVTAERVWRAMQKRQGKSRVSGATGEQDGRRNSGEAGRADPAHHAQRAGSRQRRHRRQRPRADQAHQRRGGEIRHGGAARQRQGLLRRPRRHGLAARGRADRLRAAEFLRRGVRRLWRDAQLPDPDHRRGARRRARLRLRDRRGLRHHARERQGECSRCRRWRTRSCRPW